jgi:hypothetical protein
MRDFAMKAVREPVPEQEPVPLIGQAKLVVGSAADPEERAADRMAALVMRVLRPSDGGGDAAVSTGRIRRSTRPPEDVGALQDGVRAAVPLQRIERMTRPRPDVESGALDGAARRSAAFGRIQRTTRPMVGAEGGQLDQDTEQQLRRARSGGRRLEPDLQRSMGDVMGADLSGVRLHEGPEAADLNGRMGAQAFTLGNDVFLGGRVPDSNTADGLGLIAHEVAHTVQQGASPVRREMAAGAPGAPASPMDEVPEMAGVLGKVEEPKRSEDVTGAGKLEEDRNHNSTGRRVRPSKPSSVRRNGTVVPVAAHVGSAARVSQSKDVVGEPDNDAAVGRTISGKTAIGSYSASAFGAMRTTITIEGTSWELKDGKVFIDCTLNGQLDWGVDAGGRIDVPGVTAPLITKDNFNQIADDLTPKLEGGSWRASRQTHWSAALTGRHEQYHANDAAEWIKREGPGVLIDYFSKNPITLSDDDKKDPAKVKTKVDALVHAGLQEVIAGRVFYFRAGLGQSGYLNFPGEIRAFGDGKEPYLALANGVRAHGQSLLAAATPKPTATVTAPPLVAAGAGATT